MTLPQNYYDDVERYEVPSKRCCDNPLPHTHNDSTDAGDLYAAGDQYAAADRVPAGRRRKESHVYTQIPVCSKQHRELLTRHTRWLVILSVTTLLSLLLAISSLALVFMENMTTTTAERIIDVTDNPTEGVLLTTPTTPEVTTGIPATPIQCMEAVNFTLAFRSENNGANLRPKDGQYNCDTYNMIIAGRPWFRFQAPAGIRLLDRCPPPNSCGTEGALWSDVPGPDRVGEVQLINVFVSDTLGGCKSATYNLGIIRCSSADHDFIYRHEGDATCNRGYCGTL